MATIWEKALVESAHSIAALETEEFSSAHLYRAFDELIPGPAYTADMTVWCAR